MYPIVLGDQKYSQNRKQKFRCQKTQSSSNQQGRVYANQHDLLTRPLNPEHRNPETQFVSLAPKLNSKWLNAFYMF